MQPVPKAAYRSDFRENTNFCPQRDANLGPLAPQSSVLPLDHCDLRNTVIYPYPCITLVLNSIRVSPWVFPFLGFLDGTLLCIFEISVGLVGLGQARTTSYNSITPSKILDTSFYDFNTVL